MLLILFTFWVMVRIQKPIIKQAIARGADTRTTEIESTDVSTAKFKEQTGVAGIAIIDQPSIYFNYGNHFSYLLAGIVLGGLSVGWLKTEMAALFGKRNITSIQ